MLDTLEQVQCREEKDGGKHNMQHDLEHAMLVMPQTYEYYSQPVPVAVDEKYFSISLEQWDDESIISPLYLFWHKAMDITFGLCGMVVLLLILPILALLIYLDSPGPIFYSQERLGYLGKTFRIFKFRSMCVDAEANGQAVWASEDDSRVTSIGRFMRAIHLDELP